MNGDENRKDEYQLPSIQSLTGMPAGTSPQSSQPSQPPQSSQSLTNSLPAIGQQQHHRHHQQQQQQQHHHHHHHQQQSGEPHFPHHPSRLPSPQQYIQNTSAPPNQQTPQGFQHSASFPHSSQNNQNNYQSHQQPNQEYSYKQGPPQQYRLSQARHSPQYHQQQHSQPYATPSQPAYSYQRQPHGSHTEQLHSFPPYHPQHAPEHRHSQDTASTTDSASYHYNRRQHQYQQQHGEYAQYSGPPQQAPHLYAGDAPHVAASVGAGPSPVSSRPSGVTHSFARPPAADHLPTFSHPPDNAYPYNANVKSSTALHPPQLHEHSYPSNYPPQGYPAYNSSASGSRGSATAAHDGASLVTPLTKHSIAGTPTQHVAAHHQQHHQSMSKPHLLAPPPPPPQASSTRHGYAPSGIPAISSSSSTRHTSLSVPPSVDTSALNKSLHAEKHSIQGIGTSSSNLAEEKLSKEAHEALIKRRRRNAQSAARLRERRKNREQELTTSCSQLEDQIAELEEELKVEKQRAMSDLKRTQNEQNDQDEQSEQVDRSAKRQKISNSNSRIAANPKPGVRYAVDNIDMSDANDGNDDDNDDFPFACKGIRPLRELDQVRLDDLRKKIETLGKLNQQVCVNLGMLRQEIQRISEAIILQKDRQRH